MNQKLKKKQKQTINQKSLNTLNYFCIYICEFLQYPFYSPTHYMMHWCMLCYSTVQISKNTGLENDTKRVFHPKNFLITEREKFDRNIKPQVNTNLKIIYIL